MRRFLAMLCLALGFSTQSPSVLAVDVRQELVILYPDSKLPKQAILIDIMKEVESRLPNHKFVFRQYTWARALEMAKQGLGGIISISMTKDRLAIFDYSEPMYIDEVLLVTLDQTFPFEKIEDLKGKKIIIVKGSSFGDEFERGRSTLFTAEEAYGFQKIDAQTALLKKLLAGGIDAALISPGHLGLTDAIRKDPMLIQVENRFVALHKPFARDPNYLAFAKSMQMDDFLRQFNAALAKANKSGAIQKIIDAHTKKTAPPQ